MDTQTVQTAVMVGVPILGALVWLLRLEGRQTAHEAECAQRQRNLDERHKSMTAKLDHMDAKLDRLMERQP